MSPREAPTSRSARPSRTNTGLLTLVKSGAGTLTLSNNANTYTGPTYVNAGTLEIGSAGRLGSGTYSGAITIASGATFKYNSSANQTLQTGVISGAGGLYKDNSGTLTLSATNTYAGGTIVNGGVLQLQTASSSLVGTLTINSGAQANFTNGWAYGAASPPRIANINGGTFNYTNSGTPTRTSHCSPST